MKTWSLNDQDGCRDGLYFGAGGKAACQTEQSLRFLTDEPQESQWWADPQGRLARAMSEAANQSVSHLMNTRSPNDQQIPRDGHLEAMAQTANKAKHSLGSS